PLRRHFVEVRTVELVDVHLVEPKTRKRALPGPVLGPDVKGVALLEHLSPRLPCIQARPRRKHGDLLLVPVRERLALLAGRRRCGVLLRKIEEIELSLIGAVSAKLPLDPTKLLAADNAIVADDDPEVKQELLQM